MDTGLTAEHLTHFFWPISTGPKKPAPQPSKMLNSIFKIMKLPTKIGIFSGIFFVVMVHSEWVCNYVIRYLYSDINSIPCASRIPQHLQLIKGILLLPVAIPGFFIFGFADPSK